jgi:hypothetical protein
MKRIAPYVVAALLVCPIYAQTPGTLNYPSSLDNATTLFEVANNATTAVAVELSAVATTLDVSSTSAFPGSGAFSVGSEIIYYTGKNATQLTSLVRARQGTTAAVHVVGSLVQLRYTAGHHEAVRTSIIALQAKLGVGSSTPSTDTVLKGTSTGISAWTAATGTGSPVLSDAPTLTGNTALTFVTGTTSPPYILDNVAFAADRGGILQLYANRSSGPTVSEAMAQIVGFKENGTGGNNAGYFAIFTRPNGGSLTERFRISSTGVITLSSDLPITEGGTGNSTGLAVTATALAANPTDCAANQYATTIAASGNLTCAQPSTADLSDEVAWTNEAFDAADFTGNGSMTWTLASGDVTTLAYEKTGKKVTVSFTLDTTSVGGTPSNILQIAIPGGFTATKLMVNQVFINDNGTVTGGWCRVSAGGTVIQIIKYGSGNFTASTNATAIYGQIRFQVN